MYGAVGFWLSGGVTKTAIVIAVAVFLTVRLVIVMLSFWFSRRLTGAGGCRRLTLVRLILVEWFALIATGAVLMVLPKLFSRREHVCNLPAAGRGTRVLLVHGYVCNRAVWAWFERRLALRGFDVHSVTIEPVFGDIEEQREVLARRIDALTAQHGDRLTLVAHSMGGLMARAYIRRHGAGRIEKLITFGAPHQGTALAWLGIGRCARQMDLGNTWLGELMSDAGGLSAIPGGVTAIFSHDDNLVAPQASAVVPNAKVIALRGIAHVSMPFSPLMLATVLSELPPAR